VSRPPAAQVSRPPAAAARVVFAHGLEGTPTGFKARALITAGFDVIAPDGRNLPLADRMTGIREAIGEEPAILVGSSYGGLAAAAVAVERPEVVHGLVLLAPALSLWPSALSIPASVPTTVFHAEDDDIVPFAVSAALAGRSPHVRLIRAPGGHLLIDAMPQVIEAIRKLSTRVRPGTTRSRPRG
jgi:pimeloyl-ACP methyl ester carboxylesterase